MSLDGNQQKSRIKHILETIAGGNCTIDCTWAFGWHSSYWCRTSVPVLSSSGTQSVPLTASKGGWPARPRPQRCCQLLSHRTARTLIHTLAHLLYSTAQNGTERENTRSQSQVKKKKNRSTSLCVSTCIAFTSCLKVLECLAEWHLSAVLQVSTSKSMTCPVNAVMLFHWKII